MATRRVTQRQAEQVLEQIKKQFPEYVGGNPDHGPKLMKDFEWGEDRKTPYAVVWEEGPFEWALRAFDGDVDEELSQLVGRRVDTPPVDKVPGVHCEAIFSWALGVYPR